PDHIDQHHGRDLAAAENIVADRNLAAGQRSADPIIDALVAAANDDDSRLGRKLFGHTLVERLTPRLHQDHPAWVLWPDRLHGLEHRLRLDHHARAATERHVVDLAVAIVSMVAQVMRVEFDQTALDGTPDHALVENRREHAREDGDDVKAHPFTYASSVWTSHSATTTRPPSMSTLTTASRVAGMRCSMAPSRLTQTSFEGRSRTSAHFPSSLPLSVRTVSPTS